MDSLFSMAMMLSCLILVWLESLFNAHIVFQSYFFEVAAKVLSVKPVVFFGLSGHGVLSYMMKVMLVKV